MLYRPFGRTGEQVSALGFGCMRLPVIDGRRENIDVPLATEMLHYAIDHGVNYVDTAYPYHGTSRSRSRATARASSARRCRAAIARRCCVATKLPIWMVESREDMETHSRRPTRAAADRPHRLLPAARSQRARCGRRCADLGARRLPGSGQSRRPHPLCRLLVPRRSAGLRPDRRRLRLGLLPDPVQLHGRARCRRAPRGSAYAAAKGMARDRHGAAQGRPPRARSLRRSRHCGTPRR